MLAASFSAPMILTPATFGQKQIAAHLITFSIDVARHPA
jgi:hypothetical protein